MGSHAHGLFYSFVVEVSSSPASEIGERSRPIGAFMNLRAHRIATFN